MTCGRRVRFPSKEGQQVVGALFFSALEVLRAEGFPSPYTEAATLAASACCIPYNELPIRLAEVAPAGARQRLNGYLQRRLKHEPLQTVVGTAAFLDCEFLVGPGVFIPRPETEGLALIAIELLANKNNSVVIDLCAGVGPLAVYIALRIPDARVIAVEKDPRAAALLARNVNKFSAAVEILIADVKDESLADRLPAADLVVANPPYIPSGVIPTLPPEVRDWEPRLALDGGAEGVDFYPVIADIAARRLNPGAALAVEVGEGQSEFVTEVFRPLGPPKVKQDLTGRPRYVIVNKCYA